MKTNQFRAMMLVLLMAVVSLGMVNAQAITVSGTVTDAKDGTPLVGCSVQIKGTTCLLYTSLLSLCCLVLVFTFSFTMQRNVV